MEVSIIVPKTIDQCWDKVLPYIDSFVERSYGRFTTEDVKNYIKDAIFHLWVAHEDGKIHAVAMTQKLKYPQQTELQIIMCSGEGYKDWVSYISKIESFAKEIGCKRITGITRPGWERELNLLGYKKTHVILEKELR